uniref:Wsv432-like protein n=1 Tax=Hemigrapsus takanoi nimavirus TaxID=2133792 RepID=A0A401IP51_9VIRU|nr:wsv432-like protein [Hemigrapsus takanoi nimavirus]
MTRSTWCGSFLTTLSTGVSGTKPIEEEEVVLVRLLVESSPSFFFRSTIAAINNLAPSSRPSIEIMSSDRLPSSIVGKEAIRSPSNATALAYLAERVPYSAKATEGVKVPATVALFSIPAGVSGEQTVPIALDPPTVRA